MRACVRACMCVVRYVCRLLAELRTDKPLAQLDKLCVSNACNALNHAIQSDRPRSPPSLTKAAMNGGAHHAAPAVAGAHTGEGARPCTGPGVVLRDLSISTRQLEGAVSNGAGNGRVAVNNTCPQPRNGSADAVELYQKNKSKTPAAHVSERNLDRVCKWVASKVHGGLGPDVWAVLELEVRRIMLCIFWRDPAAGTCTHAQATHKRTCGQAWGGGGRV